MNTHITRGALALGTILGMALSAPVLAQETVTNAAGNATAGATQPPLPAKTLIDQAVKTAKAHNKTVFVHISASWCGWCHKLDHALNSSDVSPLFAKHYEIVGLTALEQGGKKSLENPGVDSVMKALGLHGGPPLYAFIDGEGKEISSSLVMPNDGNIGYPAIPEEIAAFGELLKKTAPAMTDAERTKITEYLINSVK
jgi:thiol:disulfide interchange protein